MLDGDVPVVFDAERFCEFVEFAVVREHGQREFPIEVIVSSRAEQAEPSFLATCQFREGISVVSSDTARIPSEDQSETMYVVIYAPDFRFWSRDRIRIQYEIRTDVVTIPSLVTLEFGHQFGNWYLDYCDRQVALTSRWRRDCLTSDEHERPPVISGEAD